MEQREKRKDHRRAYKTDERRPLPVYQSKRQRHKSGKADMVQHHPVMVRISGLSANEHNAVDGRENYSENAV